MRANRHAAKPPHMKPYASNQAYFEELEDLAARMERSCHVEASAEVRRGISCVNGLTDGWVMLMDSLDLVIAQHSQGLPFDQRDDLRRAREAAQKAVYRL